MNTDRLFCLSGCGYLHDLMPMGDKLLARIKAITHYDDNALSKDEVWLNCLVNEREQQAYLNELFTSVQVGTEVVVSFEAEYSTYVCAFSGLKPEDPSHIVTLQSKLRSLGSCYVNGKLATNQYIRLKAVA